MELIESSLNELLGEPENNAVNINVVQEDQP